MSDTTKTLYFSISGEFIANQARDLLIEVGYKGALDFLMSSLEGLTYDQANAILQGTKTLTGVNSEIQLSEDSCVEALNKRWSECHINTFMFEGQAWKAYGYICAYNGDDMKWAKKELSYSFETAGNNLYLKALTTLGEFKADPAWRGHEELMALRSMAYARNKGSDILVALKVQGNTKVVLFEKVTVDAAPWTNMSLGNMRFQPQYLLEIERSLSSQPYFDEDEDEDYWDEDPSDQPLNVIAQYNPKPTLFSAEDLDLHDEAYLEKKRAAVLEFAKNDTEFGFKTFREKDYDSGQYVEITVPYRAFVNASLVRAKFFSLAPSYTPVCPQGLKLGMDCAAHTDAWIGCGGSFDNAYDSDNPKQRLFMTKLMEVQEEYTSFEFAVLSKGRKTQYFGVVETDPELAGPGKILVVKNADAELTDAALKSEAVICEVGSKVAHLVIVSSEEGIGVFRVEDATSKFSQGCRIAISLTTGQITSL